MYGFTSLSSLATRVCVHMLSCAVSNIVKLQHHILGVAILWKCRTVVLQVELALGSFPYGKWNTIFEQLNAVVNGPPPELPDDGRYSSDLIEFAAAW